MDRIFSARIDDRIYKRINDLSSKLHTSKKSIIEKAIMLLEKNYQKKNRTNIFIETCGIWKRDEEPEKTISHARAAFNLSMKRYK